MAQRMKTKPPKIMTLLTGILVRIALEPRTANALEMKKPTKDPTPTPYTF